MMKKHEKWWRGVAPLSFSSFLEGIYGGKLVNKYTNKVVWEFSDVPKIDPFPRV